MPAKLVELTEGEQYVLWMLRAQSRPGAPAVEIHVVPGCVQLMHPGADLGRPDDIIGEGATLEDAHNNLQAAMRLPSQNP